MASAFRVETCPLTDLPCEVDCLLRGMNKAAKMQWCTAAEMDQPDKPRPTADADQKQRTLGQHPLTGHGGRGPLP